MRKLAATDENVAARTSDENRLFSSFFQFTLKTLWTKWKRCMQQKISPK